MNHKRQSSQHRQKNKNRIEVDDSEPVSSTHQQKRLNAAIMSAANNNKAHPLTSKTSSNKNKIKQHLNSLGDQQSMDSDSQGDNDHGEDLEVEDDSFLELEDDGEIMVGKG